MSTHIIIGPPGTGKTTYITRQIRNALEKYEPENILACSFTRAAATELASRASLPKGNIGTLHSICYALLGHPELLETTAGIRAWNDAAPAQYRLAPPRATHPRDAVDDDDDPTHTEDAQALYQTYQNLRAAREPRERWPTSVAAFARAWEDYKEQTHTYDFNDLIERVLDHQIPLPSQIRVGFFDEAQDFTPLEMGLARMWAKHLEQAVFAGDEDQTIYTFKGANPRALTTLEYDHIRVLSQSFRVPAAVHRLAQRITGRISDRYPAEYHPREGAEGAVLREPPTGVRQRNPRGLARIIGETEGSVMVLASTNAGLNNTIAELLDAGIPFHNPYRAEQTAWNPLQAANGVGFAQRVSAFHRPARAGDLWTVQQVATWAAILDSRKTMMPGAKRWLDSFKESAPYAVTIDQLLQIFVPEALDRALRGDLDWYYHHLLARHRTKRNDAIIRMAKADPDALTRKPRVVVGTVHSVKGGEADTVVVYPDLSRAGTRAYLSGPAGRDTVHRLMYVAVTRARERVVLAAPTGKGAYPWP